MTASPLRYPGGKAALANLLVGIRRANALGHSTIAEPFAGGAGASLTLLYLEEFRHVHINDADTSIFSFWWTLKNRPRPFLKRLSQTRVNMTEWRRQRNIYRNEQRTSRLDQAFSTFYLNRCNRSGIILNGGPIGGVAQTGKWKLGARFNKVELVRRCQRVVEYRERIRVSNDDGLGLISKLDPHTTFFFIDPPYFEKGPALYLNALSADYHAALAQRLKQMQGAAWTLTYDDCPEIRRLYRGWASVRPFRLRYVASERRLGRELLITPKWIHLPDRQSSLALSW